MGVVLIPYGGSFNATDEVYIKSEVSFLSEIRFIDHRECENCQSETVSKWKPADVRRLYMESM